MTSSYWERNAESSRCVFAALVPIGHRRCEITFPLETTVDLVGEDIGPDFARNTADFIDVVSSQAGRPSSRCSWKPAAPASVKSDSTFHFALLWRREYGLS
jgi:hypothetical protein